MKKPELLLPAGSRAALEAAIEGGADAIYMGSNRFNARMRAENFTDEDIKSAVALASAYSVKSYITMNTRLYDSELSDALKLCASFYEMGADALIVADLGLAALVKKHIPELELHASTQLSGHSLRDCLYLQEAGFDRMVCHREITKEGLFHLCRNSPIEIEMFVHGAYCVSFSGQCLMSAVMGGRSGNRGECAQPCRQPYAPEGARKAKDYPISLKDMCLASHMEDILSSGVASLKIEGRQKSAEYVFGVCKIYRRLIDESRNATSEETEKLRRIFSRDGFTDGYFAKCHKDMRGVRSFDEYLEGDKTSFEGLKRKMGARVALVARSNERSSLSLTVGEKSVTVFGDTVKEALEIAPLTEEGAKKSCSRLGSTPFELRDFKFISDNNAALTLSAVNALRRDACTRLLDTKREAVTVPCIQPPKRSAKKATDTVFTAEFLYKDRISAEAEAFFDRIYLPYPDTSTKYGISLPPYLPDPKWEALLPTLKGRSVLCHSPSQAAAVKDIALHTGLSLRVNAFNSECARALASTGAEFITLAPEMKLAQMRDIDSPIPKSAVAYGRLPLMLTVRCAISDGCCKKKDREGICSSLLCDRHGISFPVYGMPDCTNIIYNSVPIYMADRQGELSNGGITHLHFIFTDETPEEVDRIIEAYRKALPPKTGMKIRRVS